MKKFLVLLLMFVSVPCFGASMQQALQYFYQGKFDLASEEAGLMRGYGIDHEVDSLQYATGWIWTIMDSLKGYDARTIADHYKAFLTDVDVYRDQVMVSDDNDIWDWDAKYRSQLQKYNLIEYKFLDRYGYFKDYRVYDLATFIVVYYMQYADTEQEYVNMYKSVLPYVKKYGVGKARYTEKTFTGEVYNNMKYAFGSMCDRSILWK